MSSLQGRFAAASFSILALASAFEGQASGGMARRPVAGPSVSALVYPAFGGLIVWGSNASRQLGTAAAFSVSQSSTSYSFGTPGQVRSAAFGNKHGILALDDGSVLTWGGVGAYSGYAGVGPSDPTLFSVAPRLFRSARQVAAGDNASFVLLHGGTLYAFGNNDKGQLGSVTPELGWNIPAPVDVPQNIVRVDAKCDNAAAIGDNGELWTWGKNDFGQLGIGTSGASRVTPSLVLNDVVDVAVGCDFMVALLRTGQVYAWGSNASGQLGQNNTAPRTLPTLVPVSNVVSLGAGYAHVAAVTTDGRIISWGRNSEGQLGLGHFNPQLAPAFVPGITTATGIAGGAQHTVVTLQNQQDNAEYWAVGANDSGQLGPAVAAGPSSATFVNVFQDIGSPPVIRRTGLREYNRTDVFWSNPATGQNGFWESNGGLMPTYFTLRDIAPGWIPIGTGDIDFDDVTEIFFHNPSTGDVYFWAPEGKTPAVNRPVLIADEGLVGTVNPATGWRPQQIGDLDGDGSVDILWRNVNTGNVAIWYLTSDARVAKIVEFPAVALQWQIVKTGDFDGNGVDDILWRNTATGQVNVWFKSAVRTKYLDLVIDTPSTAWSPQVVVDLDGDGRSDVFWRNTATGETFIWYMKGNLYAGAFGPTVADLQWNAAASFSGAADAGQSGILWRHAGTGEVYYWRLDNRPAGSAFTVYAEGSLGYVGADWQIGQ